MDTIWKLFPFTREPTILDKAWIAARYPIDLVASPVKAIVSIPTLSFLVIPAFSSYSTSINLLFFYMTWAVLIRTNDPIYMELYGTLGIRILFYIFPSLIFLAFDNASPKLAADLKEHGESALPTGEQQDSRRGAWWKVGLVSLANVILSVILQVGLELLATRVLYLQSLLKVSVSLPLPWTVGRDLFVGLVLREILTYTLHRYVLHSENTAIANLHESWQHSVRLPFSLVAHYDHPFAYLVHVFVPMYLPAILFRFHFLTYLLYLTLVSLEETFAYSGYNVLPSAFVVGAIARRQEKHLFSTGDGNFGCLGLADVLMGTSLGANLMGDVEDEAENTNVGREAKGKARKADRKKQKIASQNSRNRTDSEENETNEDKQDERPRRRRGSPNGLKKRNAKGGNEDMDSESTSEAHNSPVRKSGRSQRNGRKEESKPTAESTTRRGNQRGKGSRKRSGDDQIT